MSVTNYNSYFQSNDTTNTSSNTHYYNFSVTERVNAAKNNNALLIGSSQITQLNSNELIGLKNVNNAATTPLNYPQYVMPQEIYPYNRESKNGTTITNSLMNPVNDSVYTSRSVQPSSNLTSTSESSNGMHSGPHILAPRPKVHLRKALGEIWSDPTLEDWDDNDYRVFCGDLGNEVTDESLTNAFRHFKSFQRARVIRDKRTGKGKGYGFVSFLNPHDMLRALKEMDRKYVGNRPIRVMKSTWKDREIASDYNKRFSSISHAVPMASKCLRKFKSMKPITGGKKVNICPSIPPPAPFLGGPGGARGKGYRNVRAAPYNFGSHGAKI